MRRLVLDAEGLVQLRTSARLRAVVERFLAGGGEVWCSAVTVAEVARGPARAAEVAQALRRTVVGQRVNVATTDLRLAMVVGTLLHDAGLGNAHLGDAHVVAVCAAADAALVVTSDPDDITHLASFLPGVRVTCVRP